ncbi:MAG: hypothetical protein HYS34_00075 [Acidobacteria bacterium]|nr:hypothetical protein [Acidobacteriota bacterium]
MIDPHRPSAKETVPASPRAGQPTRGDRVLLLLLMAILAIASSMSPIRNYDYWWHLKTGALIVEKGEVPRADPFSFTAAGVPWVDHEWLFQVAAHLGHRALGPAALVLVKVICVLLLSLLMADHTRREGHHGAGTAILMAVALVGASFRIDVRPELFSLLGLPIVVWLALRARDRGRHRLLLLVPAVVGLWSNLHPGAILAPAVLALGSAATFLDERFAARSPGAVNVAAGRARFAPRLALTAAAAALAAAANPCGFRIYEVPVHLSRLLAALPSPNLEWARPSPFDFPLFFAAAAASAIILIVFRRSLDPIATPALVLTGCLAAAHLRNIGLFFFLLPFGLARPARALSVGLASGVPGRWLGSPRRPAESPEAASPSRARVRPGFVAAAVVLVAAVPLLAVLPPSVVWGIGIAPDNEPERAADFLAREEVGRRLYNDVRFGGYLIWRRFPEHPVFIDGRNEVYPRLLGDIFASLGDSRAWQAFLGRHDIDAAFVRYSAALESVVRKGTDGLPDVFLQRSFSANHFPREDWALVYWDDDAMIFARRSREYEGVIARLEYRAIHPEDWRYQLAGVAAGQLQAGPILEELRRKLRDDPECARARALLATFRRLADAVENSAGASYPGGVTGSVTGRPPS